MRRCTSRRCCWQERRLPAVAPSVGGQEAQEAGHWLTPLGRARRGSGAWLLEPEYPMHQEIQVSQQDAFHQGSPGSWKLSLCSVRDSADAGQDRFYSIRGNLINNIFHFRCENDRCYFQEAENGEVEGVLTTDGARIRWEDGDTWIRQAGD